MALGNTPNTSSTPQATSLYGSALDQLHDHRMPADLPASLRFIEKTGTRTSIVRPRPNWLRNLAD